MKVSWSTALMIIVVTTTLGYVMYSLKASPEKAVDIPENTHKLNHKNDTIGTSIFTDEGNKIAEQVATTKNDGTLLKDRIILPIDILVLGTDVNKNIALLESKSEVITYQLGDFVFHQPIKFTQLSDTVVSLVFNNTVFELPLYDANLLSTKNEKDKIPFSQMTSEQIGTRPKLLEHIIDLTPLQTPMEDFHASPGKSYKLFTQAGLQEGDVIKRINNINVNEQANIKALSEQVHHLDSIKFEVQRNGKLATLYLDIPSEDLTFSN